MKKMIALILVLIALYGVATAEIYPEIARVVELDYDDDTVTVETFMGFLFVFEGCEDWAEGDACAMIMDDCGTAEITDDKIVMVRYCAWTLINWLMDE